MRRSKGAAKPPQFTPEVDETDDGDLAALDARLSATSKPVEEVDVLEDLDTAGEEVDVEEANTLPPPRRSPAPPPLPARPTDGRDIAPEIAQNSSFQSISPADIRSSCSSRLAVKPYST